MADVFIAYDRNDRPLAQKFATTLGWLDYDVFWDADLTAGVDWAQRLREAIRDAKCVVALWSKDSVQSDYVKFEAILGLAEDKLISVQIEEGQLPSVLRRFQAINLVDWTQDISTDQTEELFESLQRLTTKVPNRKRWRQMTGQSGKVSRGQRAFSPTLLLAGVATAALLVGGGFFAANAVFHPQATPTRIADQPAGHHIVAPPPPSPPPPPPAPPPARDGTVTLLELQKLDWQIIAQLLQQRLSQADLAQLKTRADQGVSSATMEACIASMAGIPGFAPSEAPVRCAASVRQRHPAALYLAWLRRDALGVEYSDARDDLVAAANAGWAPAQFQLGSFYRTGQQSFPQNQTEARRLLEASATTGYTPAKLDVSRYYLLQGTAAEHRRALDYLRDVMADHSWPNLCSPARAELLASHESAGACSRR